MSRLSCLIPNLTEIAPGLASAYAEKTLAVFSKSPIVPVLTITDLAKVHPLVLALSSAGMSSIEIALRTPLGIELGIRAIELIRKKFPDVTVGAGTILTTEQMSDAISAGAQFGVSPGSSRTLMDYAKIKKFPYAPGVATATEVQHAMERGFDVLKLFPLDLTMGRAKFITDIMQPIFPSAKLLCSSAETKPSDIEEYLLHPSVLSIASGFSARSELIAQERWEEIAERASSHSARARAVMSKRTSYNGSYFGARFFSTHATASSEIKIKRDEPAATFFTHVRP